MINPAQEADDRQSLEGVAHILRIKVSDIRLTFNALRSQNKYLIFQLLQDCMKIAFRQC